MAWKACDKKKGRRKDDNQKENQKSPVKLVCSKCGLMAARKKHLCKPSKLK